MATISINAKKREETGSRAARRLREQGSVPGIVYGHGETPEQLSVDVTELKTLLRHGAHALLELVVDGQKQSVVIKDLQHSALGSEIFHIDFVRVSADERVRITVPIVIKGTARGTKVGGMLEQPLHDIEIECPASNLVENIVVNVNHLELDQAITVADLQLPEGAEAIPDPDTMVVHVVKPREETEEAEALEATSAEPELIRREAKEDETEQA